MDNTWPHIGHLIHHLLKELIDSDRIRLQMVLVPGAIEGGRYIPAKTWEMLHAFLKNHRPSPDSKALFYISENSVAHAAARQHIMTSLLQEKHGITIPCVTFHDALNSSQFETARILREIAAELHTIWELLPQVEHKLAPHADGSAPSCSYASSSC